MSSELSVDLGPTWSRMVTIGTDSLAEVTLRSFLA